MPLRRVLTSSRRGAAAFGAFLHREATALGALSAVVQAVAIVLGIGFAVVELRIARSQSKIDEVDITMQYGERFLQPEIIEIGSIPLEIILASFKRTSI